MKDITIFSTRSFGKGYLFADAPTFVSPKEAQEELNKYFGIKEEKLEYIWWEAIEEKGLLQEVEDDLKRRLPDEDYDDVEFIFGAVKNAQKGGDYEQFLEKQSVIADNYFKKLDGSSEAFLSRFVDLDGLFKKEDPTKLYQACEGVFAIHLLEGPHVDSSGKKWIPTLIKCAKTIAGEDNINLRLVLHDKDLGKQYISDDVTIIDETAIKDLAVSELKGLNSIKIVFFKHTTNAFAIDILGKPFSANRNVHAEVDHWINILQKEYPKVLRKIDEAPYGKDPGDTLKSSYNDLQNIND